MNPNVHSFVRFVLQRNKKAHKQTFRQSAELNWNCHNRFNYQDKNPQSLCILSIYHTGFTFFSQSNDWTMVEKLNYFHVKKCNCNFLHGIIQSTVKTHFLRFFSGTPELWLTMKTGYLLEKNLAILLKWILWIQFFYCLAGLFVENSLKLLWSKCCKRSV